MSYKKYLLSSILLSSLIISGCTEKDDEIKEVKPSVSEEKNVEENKDVKVEDTNDENEPSTEINRDVEKDAFSSITSFFEAFNNEDMEKMETILTQEESLRGFESLFESYDIASEIISYEVVDAIEEKWLFIVQVKYTDADETSDFTDNVSTYNIQVDTSKNIMTTLELGNTVEME
jgi:hypothetical protein